MNKIQSIPNQVEVARKKHLNSLQLLIEGYYKTLGDSSELLDTMARNHEDQTEDFQTLLGFNENMSKAYRKLEEAIKFLK